MKLQRVIAMEFLGTAVLAVAIVGSGLMAGALTQDAGLRLFINALSTAIGLAVVIRLGMKLSGAHFNPAVTVVMLILKKINLKNAVLYIFAQFTGAIAGVGLANLLFAEPAFTQSNISRDGSNLFISEIFATSILIWIILRFPKRDDLVALYVPLWIFGAILLTASTAFANPAITVGRIFTSSITGIAPESVLAFITAQLLGAVIGLNIARNITNTEKEGNE